MADKSRIEWTDATWNPVTGCTPISDGCDNCYAKRHAERFRGRFGYPADNPFQVTFHEDRLDQPLRWKRPRKIFVCSMGDLFHDDVELAWLYKIFGVIARCPQHRFMVLTKRPARMRLFFHAPISVPGHEGYYIKREGIPFEVFNHVWLGVTAENQRAADARIPILLQTPATARFVSVEPMLGPVDLRHIHYDGIVEIDALTGNHGVYRPLKGRSDAKLDWVICGGESGPGARPMHSDWARNLRDQCVYAQVPFFFKQWGEWGFDGSTATHSLTSHGKFQEIARYGLFPGAWPCSRLGKKAAGRLLDGQEWNQWPEISA